MFLNGSFMHDSCVTCASVGKTSNGKKQVARKKHKVLEGTEGGVVVVVGGCHKLESNHLTSGKCGNGQLIIKSLPLAKSSFNVSQVQLRTYSF